MTRTWNRLRRHGSRVPFEQAVYGSFAFRPGGYRILAQSPGCRPEWLAEFRAACQKLGEPSPEARSARGLYTLRLNAPGRPWAVVGMGPQGLDDRGRPGALAFHSLFLTDEAFGRVGYDPFTLLPALGFEWFEDIASLPAGSVCAGRLMRTPSDDPRAERMAEQIAEGRRILLVAPGPIDALAADVWARLPRRVRARSHVATWAFANDLRFDLVAVPRLAGVAFDASYLAPDTPWLAPDAPRDPPPVKLVAESPAAGPLAGWWRVAVLVVLLGALLAGVVALAWRAHGSTGANAFLGRPRASALV